MLGLFGTLNMGARSLQTQQMGVEVAGHNLSNVNNPNYSRKRIDLETSIYIPNAGNGRHRCLGGGDPTDPRPDLG